jgi:small-conductance mechanosensitive channel
MTPQETVCLACGAQVRDNQPKADARSTFRSLVKYFLIFTAALTVLSLFIDVGVPFAALASVTFVLFLAFSSAQEMLLDREKD